MTDFALQDDTCDVESAHVYRREGEEPSIASDLYSVGIVLYQLFTGSLPKDHAETHVAIRKQFSKLPEDIQQLITYMISTIPQNRPKDSLLKAMAVIDERLSGNDIKSFTEIPARDKKRQHIRHSPVQMPKMAIASNEGANRRGYEMLPFAVLVVVFMQYLFLFDGQEKINQSMPTVYSTVLSQFEGLLGKIDVRGKSPGENSRIY